MFQSLIVLIDGDDESSLVVNMNDTLSSDTDTHHHFTLTVTDTPRLTPIIRVKLVSTSLARSLYLLNATDNFHHHCVNSLKC